MPIDSAAPKGRLILPQQQTIRDILEAGAISLVTRETELTRTLESLREPPRLVITDSQAFGIVNKLVPKNVQLTSFSILFARYKGNLRQAILGAAQLNLCRMAILCSSPKAARITASAAISARKNCRTGFADLPAKMCSSRLPRVMSFLRT